MSALRRKLIESIHTSDNKLIFETLTTSFIYRNFARLAFDLNNKFLALKMYSSSEISYGQAMQLGKIDIENIVFCIDCPHKDIWRLEDYTEYKGTRKESHRKNEFNSWDLFKYIKQTYLAELVSKYREIALEADIERAVDDIVNEVVDTEADQVVDINTDNLNYSDQVKNKIREEVVEEMVDRLENVMDWYKSGGDGEWKGWSVEEEKEIMKRFNGE